MTADGVIPRPEDRQVQPRQDLTDWHVEGEIRCPDCGGHFSLDCPLEDVVKFTAVHDCAEMS